MTKEITKKGMYGFTDIGINEFVKRQTKDSRFTHYDGSFQELVRLVRRFFRDAKPGYREGVCLVPVPPEGFSTGVVSLHEGDELVGRFVARRPGEDPRKVICAKGRSKSPAVAVDVVLYRQDVLGENDEASTDCDWEIISVNGRITEAEPIDPDTLIANHFRLSGGTGTQQTAEQFEASLRESVLYWKDKTLVEGE